MDYMKIIDSGFRKTALVSYLSSNDVWASMAEIMDNFFYLEVDALTQGLIYRYDYYLLEAVGYTKMHTYEVLDATDFYMPERQTLIDLLADRGFKYPNLDNDLFSSQDYQDIGRDLSRYYTERGSGSFIDYFSYTLGQTLTMVSLWTTDYKSFINENLIPTGGKLFDGGTYYPTSHVRFVVDTSVTSTADITRYTELFNYMAPINLVLAGIEYDSTFTGDTYVTAGMRWHKIIEVNDTTATATNGDWDNKQSQWDAGSSKWDTGVTASTVWDSGTTTRSDLTSGGTVTTTWDAA